MRAYQNDLKEHFLINLHELLIPLVDLGGLLPGLVLLLGRLERVTTVLLTPLDNLAQHRLVDVRDRDGLDGDGFISQILDQVLDQHGPLGDGTI